MAGKVRELPPAEAGASSLYLSLGFLRHGLKPKVLTPRRGREVEGGSQVPRFPAYSREARPFPLIYFRSHPLSIFRNPSPRLRTGSSREVKIKISGLSVHIPSYLVFLGGKLF